MPPTSAKSIRATHQIAKAPPTDETWELLVHPATWARGKPAGRPVLAYAVVLVDPRARIRAAQLVEDREPPVEALAELVRQGCARPSPPCRPARPATIVVDARLSPLVEGLAEALRGWEIDVAAGPVPRAQEAAEAILDATFEGAPRWVRDESEETLAAFDRASAAFMSARPWRSVPPDTLIEARVGAHEPCYVTLMGSGGTGEVGCVVHDRLSDALSMREAVPLDGPLPFGVDSTSMLPIAALHPMDGEHLAALGRLPDRDEIFFPMRMDPDGPSRPRLSLATHAALLEALALGVKGATGTAERDVGGTTVALSWPVEVPPSERRTASRGRRPRGSARVSRE